MAVDCPAATCVEFPGRVRNVDNAVEMMGGAAAVTHGISQAHPMLSCRPRAQVRGVHCMCGASVECGGCCFNSGPDGVEAAATAQ